MEVESSPLPEAVSASPIPLWLQVVQWKELPSAQGGGLRSPEAHPEKSELQWKHLSPPSPLRSRAPTRPSKQGGNRRNKCCIYRLFTINLSGKHPCMPSLYYAIKEKGA